MSESPAPLVPVSREEIRQIQAKLCVELAAKRQKEIEDAIQSVIRTLYSRCMDTIRTAGGCKEWSYTFSENDPYMHQASARGRVLDALKELFPGCEVLLQDAGYNYRYMEPYTSLTVRWG